MRILLILALISISVKGQAHFHPVRLNVTDPEAAIAFYTSRFDCERVRDAVRTQKSRLFFQKVKKAAPASIASSIWHFGWGAGPELFLWVGARAGGRVD